MADLFAGAGLFTVPLARAVGPRGSVVAVERSGRACADAVRNAEGPVSYTHLQAMTKISVPCMVPIICRQRAATPASISRR